MNNEVQYNGSFDGQNRNQYHETHYGDVKGSYGRNPDGSFKAATKNPDGTPLSPTTLIVTPANKEVTLVVGKTYMFNTNVPCKFGVQPGGTGNGVASSNGAYKADTAGVDVVIVPQI